MKNIFVSMVSTLFFNSMIFGQNIMCLPILEESKSVSTPATKSVNDLKIVRINIHFMLKTDGTGNFNETTDGDGRNYSGYDYARNLVYYMYAQSVQNEQLNIPTGNSIPVNNKKYQFVLDAVYFWRNDATYNFNSINYSTQGKDKDSVMNIFLSYGNTAVGGYASNTSSTSHTKYTENKSYWYAYVGNRANGIEDGGIWDQAINTSHEMGHLLTLSHTVQWNSAPPCPTGCPGSTTINTACDDGCTDTPSAWEITQANNCTRHPACGWPGGIGGWVDCSNNLMDYTGRYALSPCQINKIHSGLEGGLRSYLSCAAVADDVSFQDLGYPKISYFGKNILVGTTGSLSDITNQEKIQMYYSSTVELTNFEVRSDSEFEVILERECVF